VATWPSTIDHIYNGDPADEDNLNKALIQLGQRTEYLRAQIDGFTAKSVTLLQNVPIATSVFLGAVVQYDIVADNYGLAQAVWSSTYGTNGELVESSVARAVGVVVVKNGTYADVLMLGEYRSQAVVDGCLGAGAPVGLYYLSSTEPGTGTLTAPGLEVPVMLNKGDGEFVVFPVETSKANHFHTQFTLDDAWLVANVTNFPGMTIPATATYGYDLVNDPAMVELFTVYHGELVLFKDGVLVPRDDYSVNLSNIWWLGADPTGSLFEVFAYTPFSNGEPLVRVVELSTPDEMTATADNGILTLGMKPWTDGATAPSATALSRVSGRARQYTPVVSSVQAGPGVAVDDLGAGAIMVSSSELMNSLIDADLVNLDNAVESTDSVYTFLNMPAGRTSSIIGRIPIPKFDSTGIVATPFAIVKGVVGATTFPETTVQLVFVPTSAVGSYTDLGSVVTVNTTFAALTTASTRLYQILGLDDIDVASEGTLYIKLTSTTPAQDKNFFRFGVVLSVPTASSSGA